jgi:putative nucleotidyltransferase with HDIG domain
MSVRGDDDGTRWAARPTLARGIRVAVFAAPVAAAVGVSSVAHLAVGAAGSRVEQAWHLALLIAVSTATLVLVDRIARRALPLATLLELSMLFPDRSPSRLAVAREAIRQRPVEEQLARVREAGADPAVAARQILGLVAAMRVHDRPTRGHAERVRMLTDLVAEAMNIPARDRDLLRWAAILHDIGKLRVPPAILNKPGKPTEAEWAVLRAHPEHGAQIAGALLPWLGEWGDVIIQHHERYDGTGYPSGLAGRGISLGGRIVAVADAYEVMTAGRPYRRPVSRVAAHRELVKWSGQQFDPAIVRAMVGLSAPRLRRAQGLLAWLSDIPMVATSYVPAATVARVVGAGALATGAATGVGLPTAVFAAADVPVPSNHGSVSSISSAASAAAGSTDGGTAGTSRTSNQADHRADVDGTADAATAATTVAITVANPRGKAAVAVPTTDPAQPASKKGNSSSNASPKSVSAKTVHKASPNSASVKTKKAPVKSTPVKGTPVKKAPVKKAPVKNAPVKSTPVKSTHTASPNNASVSNPSSTNQSGNAKKPKSSAVVATVTSTVTAVAGTVDTTVSTANGVGTGVGNGPKKK